MLFGKNAKLLLNLGLLIISTEFKRLILRVVYVLQSVKTKLRV